MKVQLEILETCIKIQELAEGDYFWYSDELYIRPIIDITNTHFPGIEDVILVFCISDESLMMMSPVIKVIPETRDLTIIIDKIQQR